MVRAGWRVALIAAVMACAGVAGMAQTAGQGPQSCAKPRAAAPSEAHVDINHATASDLMQVPGMTETWAARIVRFRPYRTKQDLLDKGVVTSQVYDRIKDYVIAHKDIQ